MFLIIFSAVLIIFKKLLFNFNPIKALHLF